MKVFIPTKYNCLDFNIVCVSNLIFCRALCVEGFKSLCESLEYCFGHSVSIFLTSARASFVNYRKTPHNGIIVATKLHTCALPTNRNYSKSITNIHLKAPLIFQVANRIIHNALSVVPVYATREKNTRDPSGC